MGGGIMAITRCTGQDPPHFKADDVYEIPCPECGAPAEFFKDGHSQKCAKLCKYADECLD